MEYKMKKYNEEKEEVEEAKRYKMKKKKRISINMYKKGTE